jgi:hypothetical protein
MPITKSWPEQGDNLVKSSGALPLWKSLEEWPRKGPEPAIHVGRKESRAGNQIDRVHSEPGMLQFCLIFVGGRKIPGVQKGGVLNTVPGEDRDQGHCDGRNISVASKLTGEPGRRA